MHLVTSKNEIVAGFTANALANKKRRNDQKFILPHAFSYKEKATLQIGGLLQCSRIPLEVSFEFYYPTPTHPQNFRKYFGIF